MLEPIRDLDTTPLFGRVTFIGLVRVPTPAALEDLLQQIRTIGGVCTRTTVVLSTPYENRPPDI